MVVESWTKWMNLGWVEQRGRRLDTEVREIGKEECRCTDKGIGV